MTTRLIYTVHGFASFSGRGQTERLVTPLESAGFRVIQHRYGFKGAIWVAINNGKEAQKLASDMHRVKDQQGVSEIIGVGHSNGCLILKKAADLGAPIDQLVLLAPALDADAQIDPRVKRILVYYAPTDIATGIARWLPFSEWGSMGNEGSVIGDGRFVNVNRSRMKPPTYGHLDLFAKDKVGSLVDDMVMRLNQVIPVTDGGLEHAK